MTTNTDTALSLCPPTSRRFFTITALLLICVLFTLAHPAPAHCAAKNAPSKNATAVSKNATAISQNATLLETAPIKAMAPVAPMTPELAPAEQGKEGDTKKPEQAAAKAETEDKPSAPAEEALDPAQEQWNLLWAQRIKEVASVRDELDALQKNLPNTIKNTSDRLLEIQNNYYGFLAFSQFTTAMPDQLYNVMRQMEGLERQVGTVIKPISDRLDSFARRLDDIDGLETELNISRASKKTEIPPALKSYLDTISQNKIKLITLQNSFNGVLESGKNLKARLGATIKQIQTAMPRQWEEFYQANDGNIFSFRLWSDLPRAWEKFSKEVRPRLASEFPRTKNEWLTVLARMLMVIIPVGLFWLVVSRRKKVEDEAEGGESVESGRPWIMAVRNSLPWLVLGAALHFAAWGSPRDAHLNMIALGNIFQIWGQLNLAWDLRKVQLAISGGHPPFSHLFIPVALAFVFMTLNPPLAMLCPLWIAVLAVALWSSIKRDKKTGLPPLEQTALRIEPFILAVNLLLAAAGAVRLSLLVYTCYVAVAVTIQLSVGFLGLCHAASERLPEDGVSAGFRAAILAMAAPAILLLVFFAIFLWALAFPGVLYLVNNTLLTNVTVGTVSFDALRVLFIISLFFITRSAIVAGKAFLWRLPNASTVDASIVPPLQTALTYALWGLFALYVMNALGVSLTSLAVVAGGLSVGIGFGLQTIFNNFISGLILIFGRSLQEGDVIEVGGIQGVVSKINIRSTTVETYDNAVIFVPNSELVSTRLTNWTRNGRSVRRDIKIGVGYGSDVELVMKLLKRIAASHPRVMRDPAPSVAFTDFGPSSLDFMVRLWVEDINVATGTLTDLRVDINRTFKEKNIEISFPQLDVHLYRAASQDNGEQKEQTPNSALAANPGVAPTS